MRKSYYMILLAALTSSCSGFLDEVDKDKLIPSKTEHYAAVLLSEFSSNQACFRGIDFMADNLTEYSYTTEDSRKAWKSIYTWQMEIELNEEGKRQSNNTAWKDMYEDIAVANYVIEQIDDATGLQSERDFIKGEAYFVRGWSYLELANLYGLPYQPASAQTDLGVPLKTDNAILQTYSRASVADTYELIISDLQEAQRLIAQSGVVKSKYHPNVAACNLLLSRAYLYMQNWEQAASYAGLVIENNSLSKMTADVPYATESRSDILYSSQVMFPLSDTELFEQGWRTHTELLDLYHEKDIRLEAFFRKITGKMGRVYYPVKRTSSFTSLGNNFLRVAEAYLNRAEAYYHTGGNAENDLRLLLESRYQDKSAIVINSGEALLEQILTERRKELCFEGHHRWFDLRRMGNRPEITHDFTLTDSDGNNIGTQRYTLRSDDLNYTLPIPLGERDNNPLIKNNERYDKLPENI